MRFIRYLFMSTFVAGWSVSGPLAAQDPPSAGPRLAARVGVSLSNRYGQSIRESGPSFAMSYALPISHRLGLEGTVGATFFPSSVAIPTCAPRGGGCETRVLAPGTLTVVSLSGVVQAARGVQLLGGLGLHAGVEIPTSAADHRTTAAVLGGLRVIPFGRGRRGLILELTTSRLLRGIGAVSWFLTPSVGFAF